MFEIFSLFFYYYFIFLLLSSCRNPHTKPVHLSKPRQTAFMALGLWFAVTKLFRVCFTSDLVSTPGLEETSEPSRKRQGLSSESYEVSKTAVSSEVAENNSDSYSDNDNDSIEETSEPCERFEVGMDQTAGSPKVIEVNSDRCSDNNSTDDRDEDTENQRLEYFDFDDMYRLGKLWFVPLNPCFDDYIVSDHRVNARKTKYDVLWRKFYNEIQAEHERKVCQIRV